MKQFFRALGGYLIRLKYEALVGMCVVAYVAAYNAAAQVPGISPKAQTIFGWLGVMGTVLGFFIDPLRKDKNRNGIPDDEEEGDSPNA